MLSRPGEDSPLDEEISSSDLDRQPQQSPDIRDAIQNELNKRYQQDRETILGAIETLDTTGAYRKARRTLTAAIRKTPGDVQRAVLNVLDQDFNLSSCRSLKSQLRSFLQGVVRERFNRASSDIQHEIQKNGRGSRNNVENRLQQAIDDIRDDIFDGANEIINPELSCARPRG